MTTVFGKNKPVQDMFTFLSSNDWQLTVRWIEVACPHFVGFTKVGLNFTAITLKLSPVGSLYLCMQYVIAELYPKKNTWCKND